MVRTRPAIRTQEAGAIVHVAAYLRVSTDEQRESGLGIAAQRSRVLGMAAAKGWPEPVEYADEGVSGTKEAKDRPALAHLLADVRAGKLDAVIVLSLDRLGRRTQIVLSLVEQLDAAGVKLISCKEGLDASSPQGAFVLTMFAALAQLERDMIAQRTRDALAELDRTTGDPGGRLPYGYVRTANGVRVDRQAAATVRRIFEWHRRGVSMNRAALRLRESGMPSPRGATWHHTSVREILKNRAAYLGGKRGASERRWPAILGTRADEGIGESDQ